MASLWIKGEHTLKHGNKQDAKIALVTGSARRIGAAIADYLHQKGFRVVIHCHQSIDEAQTLVLHLNQKRPDSAMMISADLRQKENAQVLISKTIAWAGQLDLLVNNASVFAKTPMEHPDETQWDALFTINVKAPFWLSLGAFSYLKEVKGAIVNITDIHALQPLKGYTIYCQSKSALDMQTKSLAREFAPYVRVNAIAPGAILWPLNDNALSEHQQEAIIAKTPLKTHGNPSFIAQAVFMMVDNPFITGQTLKVDGGRT